MSTSFLNKAMNLLLEVNRRPELLRKILEISSHNSWLKTRNDHYGFVKSLSHPIDLTFPSDLMKPENKNIS